MFEVEAIGFDLGSGFTAVSAQTSEEEAEEAAVTVAATNVGFRIWDLGLRI